MSEEIKRIPLGEIKPSPENRLIGGFNEEKLQQLADSIRDVGVQQPIILRVIPDQRETSYEIVAGERRWRAAKIADLIDIPAVIRDIDDVQLIKIQTIENLQREDVHPLDEAAGFSRLMEKAGYDVDRLAKELGKSSSYVYQRLKLLELSDKAKKAFIEERITPGHAILIARLAHDRQNKIIDNYFTGKHMLNNDISVRYLASQIKFAHIRDLSNACWKKNEAGIYPKAGACEDCDNRSGKNMRLADGITDENDKIDYCFDVDCYVKKEKAFLTRQIKTLEENKTEYFMAINSYEADIPDNVLRSWDWQECKEKDPEAKRVILVGGLQKGRLTWGKFRKKDPYNQSPEEKEKEKEKQKQYELEEKFRQKLFQEILKKEDKLIKLFRYDILKIFLLEAWKNSCDVANIGELEGWKETEEKEFEEIGVEKIKQMNENEMLAMMIKCIIVDDLNFSKYYFEDDVPENLLDMARLAGLDPDQIREQLKKEEAIDKEQPKEKAKTKSIKALVE